MTDEHWMRITIEKAREGISGGQTPFGAAIVRGDELIIAAHNLVWQSADITAHAEVTAIRQACQRLKLIDLSGCTIYSTCEPCPMCFAACHWARLDRIVYGASIADAAGAGFNEMRVGNAELKRLSGSLVMITPDVLKQDAAALFGFWKRHPQSRVY
ncbi:MAG TPA: nucleoside deaminase [Tepidisphaeraceae bacterium]|nr:nucleoside deaminase [Tepidisphaeraceae bacterium]